MVLDVTMLGLFYEPQNGAASVISFLHFSHSDVQNEAFGDMEHMGWWGGFLVFNRFIAIHFFTGYGQAGLALDGLQVSRTGARWFTCG